MKEILCISNNYIKEIKDNSDDLFNRLTITFNKNDLKLSIIQGHYSYGGDEGLYEIAVLDNQDAFIQKYNCDEDKGSDVIGYCTKAKVLKYINKVGNIE